MTATSQSRHIAVAFAVGANFLLAIMNASVKWLTARGYDTFQITCTDGCIGLLALTAWIAAQKSLHRLKTREKLMVLYVGTALMACFCLFTAFGTGHIAEVSTVVASAPLMIAPLSYIFLGERMTRAQMVCAVAGFAGVMLVLNPRPELGSVKPLLIALFGTLMFSFNQILVKKMTGKVYTLAFTFYFYACLVVLAGALAHFKPMTMETAPVFALTGLCDVASLVLLYSAYNHAPASLVAPFNYTNILWTSIFGYVIWRETLDSWTIAGAGLVVTAGLLFVRSMLGKSAHAA
jgi:drug/metabolite transporter (DMT)-like permease